MGDFEIEFECRRAEYEIQPATGLETLNSSWLLVQTGPFKKVSPTAKQMKSAVDLLVRCDRAQLPKVALGIARALGGLAPGFPRESSRYWEGMADKLRGMFEGEEEEFHATGLEPVPPSDSAQRVEWVGVYLIPDKGGGRKLAIRPTGLQQALPLYCASMIATGTTFHTCEHCNAPFLGGGAGRGRNKKRADARFCSDACRYGYHNESRRQTKSKTR